MPQTIDFSKTRTIVMYRAVYRILCVQSPKELAAMGNKDLASRMIENGIEKQLTLSRITEGAHYCEVEHRFIPQNTVAYYKPGTLAPGIVAFSLQTAIDFKPA